MIPIPRQIAGLPQAFNDALRAIRENILALSRRIDDLPPGGGSSDWPDLTNVPAAIDAIDGLTPAADRVAYYTGATTAALTPLT
jgi:hypothetical protein